VAGEAGQKNAAPVKDATGESDYTRPAAVQPKSTEECSYPYNENGDGEGESDLSDAPSKLPRQWHTKNAPGVNRAQRNL
jgi:hypothetical protein